MSTVAFPLTGARRTCSACGAGAYWHDEQWVCDRCGSEWNSDHDRAQYAPPTPLSSHAGAVYRTARRRWRCTCADDVIGYYARGHYSWRQNNGLTGRGETSTPVADRDTAERVAAAMLGGIATTAGTRYERTEVVARPNPNAASRSPLCVGWIERGDVYVENLGESAPYQAGTRYCLPCGVAAWGER